MNKVYTKPLKLKPKITSWHLTCINGTTGKFKINFASNGKRNGAGPVNKEYNAKRGGGIPSKKFPIITRGQ